MQTQRPLSPHLQIYKPQLTSVMSIMHRLTGIILTTAVLALVLWLFAVASAQTCFESMIHFYQTWFGKLLLWGWWTCFFYHLGNGIRHLAWDSGHGFELKETYASGWAVAAFTAFMGIIGLVVIL
jgi:succinate dehydrogenase / fumarate reductase cytochrome b subunit